MKFIYLLFIILICLKKILLQKILSKRYNINIDFESLTNYIGEEVKYSLDLEDNNLKIINVTKSFDTNFDTLNNFSLTSKNAEIITTLMSDSNNSTSNETNVIFEVKPNNNSKENFFIIEYYYTIKNENGNEGKFNETKTYTDIYFPKDDYNMITQYPFQVNINFSNINNETKFDLLRNNNNNNKLNNRMKKSKEKINYDNNIDNLTFEFVPPNNALVLRVVLPRNNNLFSRKSNLKNNLALINSADKFNLSYSNSLNKTYIIENQVKSKENFNEFKDSKSKFINFNDNNTANNLNSNFNVENNIVLNKILLSDNYDNIDIVIGFLLFSGLCFLLYQILFQK